MVLPFGNSGVNAFTVLLHALVDVALDSLGVEPVVAWHIGSLGSNRSFYPTLRCEKRVCVCCFGCCCHEFALYRRRKQGRSEARCILGNECFFLFCVSTYRYCSHTFRLGDGSEMSCVTTIIRAEVDSTDQLPHRDSTIRRSQARPGEKTVFFNIMYPLGNTRQYTNFVNGTQPGTPAATQNPRSFLLFDGLEPHFGKGHNGTTQDPEYRFFAGMCWKGDESIIGSSVDFLNTEPAAVDTRWKLD
jgi:hypothetical protein